MIATPSLPDLLPQIYRQQAVTGGLRTWLRGAGESGGPDELSQLRAAKEAAEAANEAKTRFLASVSHEIRSPLNAIYGYAQLIERNQGKDAVSAARVIRRSAEHLAHLVEGLLDMSLVEGGALKLDREAIRFPEFLDQLIAMLELQAQTKGIALVLERPPGLPEFVHADPKRLRQVLINLLANAIKFTDQGQVTLRVGYRNELATFDVIDTGIGIAPEDAARIFAPFERVAGPGADRAGVGLGLAITQALVQIMGGEVRVESALGEGSRFTVRLMLSQPHAPPIAPAPEPGAVTGYLGRERWVLLIDDDPVHLGMVRGLLEPLGFQVRTASDSETGLALAAQVQPDLVLCDVALAGESGWDLAALLRRRHGAGLRIVMLSGEGPQSAGSPQESPANDTFVMKPFDFTVLLDVIAEQIDVDWVRAVGQPRSTDAAGFPPLPQAIAGRAAAHCAEIERLVRIGHVRAIEVEIDAIAALGPEAMSLAERMHAALDSFDLKALASLARSAQTHAA
ncbi:MAG: response regulator [Sphingomonadales bacterium]|nr:MAG: response regulator [Sphingomonadales bacterium]